MIIVITPFIEDKARCRLVNLRKDGANAKVNLAEPWWYANDHFDVLCLMYGGRADKRPDIFDLHDLDSIERALDDYYCDFELVHIPADLYLNVDAIQDIVRNRRFLSYQPLSENHLSQPFIRADNAYYQIPVSVVDACDPEFFPKEVPVIWFEAGNRTQEINDWLSRLRNPGKPANDQVSVIPIGAWCGAAEALKSLGLRKEAYPFDYIRTDLGLITDLLDAEPLSAARVSELLFEEGPNARAEFVHHQKDDAATRDTFVNRTLRFVDRIRNSDRPMLFVRVTHSNPDLATEIRQCREWLAVVDRHSPGRRNRLVLIANFHDLVTGKFATFDGGRIILWNAMGAFGWRVPNNWHVITNFAKIISHELHYFDQSSAVNCAVRFDHIAAQFERQS